MKIHTHIRQFVFDKTVDVFGYTKQTQPVPFPAYLVDTGSPDLITPTPVTIIRSDKESKIVVALLHEYNGSKLATTLDEFSSNSADVLAVCTVYDRLLFNRRTPTKVQMLKKIESTKLSSQLQRPIRVRALIGGKDGIGKRVHGWLIRNQFSYYSDNYDRTASTIVYANDGRVYLKSDIADLDSI